MTVYQNGSIATSFGSLPLPLDSTFKASHAGLEFSLGFIATYG
jgi:hypothetical protein